MVEGCWCTVGFLQVISRLFLVFLCRIVPDPSLPFGILLILSPKPQKLSPINPKPQKLSPI